MRSCDRPLKRSASDAFPSSVSKRYSLSIRTHGSSWRRRASSSLRRVNSFSALSKSFRATSHSARETTSCVEGGRVFSETSVGVLIFLYSLLCDHLAVSPACPAARPRRTCSRTLAEASLFPYSSCQFHHSYGGV